VNTRFHDSPEFERLNEVIERKTGIPISLSVLYQALAERLGLILERANLPSHFMLRLSDPAQPLFIDPSKRGRQFDRRAAQQCTSIDCTLELTAALQSHRIGRPAMRFARNLSSRTGL
jgi:regulator of sirC expression with transglutaminase-like and TPR domain